MEKLKEKYDKKKALDLFKFYYCYTSSPHSKTLLKQNVDKSTMCYTKDGILLEMTTTQIIMTSTKILRSVDANTFTIPATPKDLTTY